MNFDPSNTQFWDAADTEREMRRVFDVCQGCRRCLPLCPSFPTLFDFLDQDEKDGDAQKLERAEIDRVVELCYECKLCYNHCPYTPPHEWDVDFPRLVLRAKAVQARQQGVSLQDRLLGNADFVGRWGTRFASLANWTMENRTHRKLLQQITGIEQSRKLPHFSRRRFSDWFRRRQRQQVASISESAPPSPRVAFFATCSVEYNRPQTGQAAIAVLEKNGVLVELPEQRCCGMPYLDGGDIEHTVENARYNVARLAPLVEKGCTVVTPGPTCSYMLKQEYPLLLKDTAAEKVAAHTQDLCEYLIHLHKQGKLSLDFSGPVPRWIAYHLPCHLKAQNIGFRSRDLLRLIPNTQVELIDQCSGMDGTWGMKSRFYQLSSKIADRLVGKVQDGEPEAVATDCPLAALQMEDRSGLRPEHPVEILCRAYGLESVMEE
ncbi:MAG: hypothetical protein A3H27_03045 [Acidobacteria bacterium RIFCSPLOWO2_02_FULL_59_13]|nr:MAG: hypothetical protein A3H27_03045 [Acidobacteria bacterium RIFCSPLOWO2_02_FULL_59_13]